VFTIIYDKYFVKESPSGTEINDNSESKADKDENK
jgi:hypothetical protein